MKIKHWQGYGFVEATKTSKTTKTVKGLIIEPTKVYTMKIKVKGNHEYGVDCSHDKYFVKQWLLDKFDKATKELNDNCILKLNGQYLKDEDNQEVFEYTIVYTHNDSWHNEDLLIYM